MITKSQLIQCLSSNKHQSLFTGFIYENESQSDHEKLLSILGASSIRNIESVHNADEEDIEIRTILYIFQVNDQYFSISQYYDSWADNPLEFHSIQEVEKKEIKVEKWVPKLESDS